jgi:hypothetical protein
MPLGGGIIDNPFPYANQAAGHINYTPYLFSFVYALWSSINCLYLVVFLLNYIGIAYFTWKILKHLSSEETLIKFLWAFSLFASSSFILPLQDKCYFTLFSTPLVLAMYYFLIKGRKLVFFLITIFLCLTQEDVPLFVMSLSVYIFFFEPERRSYSYFSFGFALVYFIFAISIVQPAARYEFTTVTGSLAMHNLKNLRPLSIINFIKEILPIIAFFPAFVLTCFIFKKAVKQNWLKITSLIFIAPLSHWGITAVEGAGAHLLFVVLCVFLALLLLIGSMKHSNNFSLVSHRLFFIGILLIFFGFNVYLTRGDIPIPIKNFIKRTVFKNNQKINADLAEQDTQRDSNNNVIEAVRNISPDQSLVYWTNRGVDAFMSSRSDLWRFPMYFDLADFLVIQKDAKETFFQCELIREQGIKTSLDKGTHHSSGEKVVIPKEVIDEITHDLTINQKTHCIVTDSEHVLVLKRLQRHTFIIPPFSVGFEWISNISKLFDRKK